MGNFSNAHLFESSAGVGDSDKRGEQGFVTFGQKASFGFLLSLAAHIVYTKDHVHVGIFIGDASFSFPDLFGLRVGAFFHLLVFELVVPGKLAVVERPGNVYLFNVARFVKGDATTRGSRLLDQFVLGNGLGHGSRARGGNESDSHFVAGVVCEDLLVWKGCGDLWREEERGEEIAQNTMEEV